MATLALKIYQGDDWSLLVEARTEAGDPIDMSAATIAAQLREYATSDVVLAACTVDMTDAATGDVLIGLAAAVTADLPSRCVWDYQVDHNGSRSTWLAGPVTVVREVTR